MNTNAAIAFTRFGLGRRRDEPVPANPKAWLLAQLNGPNTVATDGLPSCGDALLLIDAFQRRDKTPGVDAKTTPQYLALEAHEKAERDAYIAQALTTESGFRERLVWFWYNHFTVSARTRQSATCLGPYIREAIRANVTGKFSDMVLAVMRHPAMLAYLDQHASVGPESRLGLRTHHGLNENLARECLELHTVTPAAGYTQDDVTNFAKVLTGWNWDIHLSPPGFRFVENAHEPGEQTVLGRTWPDGEQGGVMLLEFLANHPCTQRHLAEKLVRHFVADDPRREDVAYIEAVLRNNNGDLREAAAALVELPDAWAPLTKLRTPQEYVVAVMRAVGAHPAAEPQLFNTFRNLGQPLFAAPFPIGWPDRAADWANPEAILQRVDFAYQFSDRVTDQEPVQIAEATLGPLLTDDTGQAVRRAGSRREALTLLLASPEFQRR
jgi:uncharacterized protein (DUF1800 family)